jgi:dTDP-4-amino-4,6-dideoxygalactose transaminase
MHLEQSYAVRTYSNFGPAVRRFEERLADRFGMGRRAITVCNCTSGLVAALQALLSRRGKVVIPAFTFAATAHAVIAAGCEPVLADIDGQTLQLSRQSLEEALGTFGAEITAVMPVRAFGMYHPLDDIHALARSHGVSMIVDAAAAIGAPASARVSRTALVEVFSFHATKCFAIGEGGVILAPQEHESALRSACNFGFVDGTVRGDGLNAKLSDFGAAVGLAVLESYAGAVSRRVEIARRYLEALTGSAQVERMWNADLAPWATFPVLLKPGHAALRVVEQLKERGIEARRYYEPLHHMMRFAELKRCRMDVTEDVAPRMVCLPVYSDMTREEQSEIVNRLHGILI